MVTGVPGSGLSVMGNCRLESGIIPIRFSVPRMSIMSRGELVAPQWRSAIATPLFFFFFLHSTHTPVAWRNAD